MSDDDFNEQLGNALSGRVGKRSDEEVEEEESESESQDPGDTGSAGETSSTGAADTSKSESGTESVSTSGPDPDPTSTRNSRTKLAVYLTEEFQEELNNRYKQKNAQRVIDDKGEIEKHKHFLEAVLRAGLDSEDLDAYIEEMVERY